MDKNTNNAPGANQTFTTGVPNNNNNNNGYYNNGYNNYYNNNNNNNGYNNNNYNNNNPYIYSELIRDNGENLLNSLADICKWISIVLYAVGVILSFAKDKEDLGPTVLLFGGLILVFALIFCQMVKVFCNISRKATAIYQLLHERKQGIW